MPLSRPRACSKRSTLAIFLLAVSSSTGSKKQTRVVSWLTLGGRGAKGCTPPLLRSDNVLQDFLPELSNKRLLLLHVGMKSHGRQHLPDGHVESVDSSGRLLGVKVGSKRRRDGRRREESREDGSESLEEKLERTFPVIERVGNYQRSVPCPRC